MNAKVTRIAVPVLIVVIAAVAAVGLSKARKPPEKVSEAKAAILVEVQPVTRQDVVYQIESQGAVTPKTETSLVSEVNGRIVRVADDFVEGGFFKAGDVLVQIEPADYQTSVKAAEAALANAQAALEEEKARVKVAEEDWRSFQAGTAPQLGLRRPQLASALAKVRSAEADLDRAKRDLARTEIRAPYAGMVKSRTVDLGQFVSRGTSIGVIYGTDIAEVRLPLTDNDLAYLDLPKPNQTGAKPAVRLEAVVAGQTLSWTAELARTEGVLDERSRVIYAVAEINDPYQLAQNDAEPLRFGRFVQAKIVGRTASQVVVVPRHLLRPSNQLLVIDESSKLQFRQVNIDRSDEQQAFILDGFVAGDQILYSPVTNPMPGLVVRVNGAPATKSDETNAPETDEKKPSEAVTANTNKADDGVK
jgi:RND family efflux transporter MFP subunit